MKEVISGITFKIEIPTDLELNYLHHTEYSKMQ